MSAQDPPAGTPIAGAARDALARHAGAVRGGVADPAAAAPVPGAPLVNLANGLTLVRLVLVPVVLALAFAGGGHSAGWRVAAWAGFAAASVTDRFDGQVARRRGLVTSFGKLADPIADKMLIGGALIALSVLGDLPWWVTTLILAREVGVTVLRFWVIRHGVIPASRGGKLKTLLQGLAIGCYLLPIGAGPLGTARAALMAAAVVVTVATGADYVGRALTLRRTSARAEAKRRAGR